MFEQNLAALRDVKNNYDDDDDNGGDDDDDDDDNNSIQFSSLLLMCHVNSSTPITDTAQCTYW
jgi:hypothetical protein